MGGTVVPAPYVTGSHLRLESLASLPIIALALAGCIPGSSPPPVTAIPTSAAACEAMRPAFPLPLVSYDSKADTPQTVADIRADNARKKGHNARFQAACP